MIRLINRVFVGNSLNLLKLLPTGTIHAVISDPMFGSSRCSCGRYADWSYDWGPDPANGDPETHWKYHEPFYRECRRVLVPNGILAWSQSVKFTPYFQGWFGGHRQWTLLRMMRDSRYVSGQLWMVQTRERKPVPFPSNKDGVIIYDGPLPREHPCPKPVEEMTFLVSALTSPGQIVLDPFCGLGSTLIACKRLNRKYIGCDLSRSYCQRAIKRLKGEQSERVFNLEG